MSVEMPVDQVPVRIGGRVRDARAARGWTLDQLAERSGVSRRMIVNVESGTSNASIATLLRLATALQVSLAYLVTVGRPEEALVVTTPTDRQPVWRGEGGGSAVLLASADTPDMLELWDWTLEPGEVFESEAHRPGTRELVHVVTGQLGLTVGGELRLLWPGEAASYAGDVAHAYENSGQRPVRFTMTVFEPLARVRP